MIICYYVEWEGPINNDQRPKYFINHDIIATKDDNDHGDRRRGETCKIV